MRRPPWLVALTCGCVWWLVGFLPWILHSLLDEGSTGWMSAPFVLPGVVDLVAMATLGGVAAAVASVWLTRSTGLAAVGVGVGGAVLLAVLQSGVVVSASDTAAADDRVILVLQAATGVTAAAGVLLGLLAVRAGGPVRAAALALPAVLLPEWFAVLQDDAGTRTVLLGVALGIALGVSVTAPWHLVGWLPAAAIAWVSQAGVWGVLAASSQIRPGSGLSRQPMLPVEVGWEVFTVGIATPSAHLLRGWCLAVALAAVVAVVQVRRHRVVADGPIRVGS